MSNIYKTTHIECKKKTLMLVLLFATPWTVAYQALRSLSVYGVFQARVLEWVAISFSRGSSQPRDRTLVSRTAGRCFTIWATREALQELNWTLITNWAIREATTCMYNPINVYIYVYIEASVVAQLAKNLPAMQATWVWSRVRRIPWRRKWQPTPIFLLGEVHRQRNLAGYSLWTHKSQTRLSHQTTTTMYILPMCIYTYVYLFLYTDLSNALC